MTAICAWLIDRTSRGSFWVIVLATSSVSSILYSFILFAIEPTPFLGFLLFDSFVVGSAIIALAVSALRHGFRRS